MTLGHFHVQTLQKFITNSFSMLLLYSCAQRHAIEKILSVCSVEEDWTLETEVEDLQRSRESIVFSRSPTYMEVEKMTSYNFLHVQP